MSGAPCSSSPGSGVDACCPVLTTVDRSVEELAQPDFPEIKAYKLGKRRWSYNQFELRVLQAGTGGASSVEVIEAVQFPPANNNSHGHSTGESPSSTAASSPMAGNDGSMHSLHHHSTPPTPAEEASVAYQVRLGNGYRIRVVVFVVHEDPVAAVSAAGATHFTWRAVARSECKKGCSGPVLRSIQRFGRLGRRSGAPPNGGGSGGGSPVMPPPPSSSSYDNETTGSPGSNNNNPCNSPAERDKVKEAKYLYLSIDEAGTHVGARAFRLVAAAYDAAGLVPLGATVSPPIRVLANNDVPTGAAFVTLHLPLRADWQGWVPGRSGGGAGVAAAMRAAAAAAAGIASSPLGRNSKTSSNTDKSSLSSSPAVAVAAAAAAGTAGASPPRSPNKRPAASAAAKKQQQQAKQTQNFASSSLPHLLLSHAVSSSLLNDPSASAAVNVNAAAAADGGAAPPARPPPVSAAAVASDDGGEFGGGSHAAAGNGGSPPKRQRKQQGGEGGKEIPGGATRFSLSAGAGVPAPQFSAQAAAAEAKPPPLSSEEAAAAAAVAAPSPSAALAARLFLTGVGSPTASAGAAAAHAGSLFAAGLPRLAASRLFSIGGGGGSGSGNSPSAPGSPGLPQLAPALLGSWGAQHHHHLLAAIGHGGVSGSGLGNGHGGSSSGGSGSPLALDALSSGGGNTPTAWRTASLSALVAGWPMTPRSAAIAQAATAAGTGLQSAGGSGNPLQLQGGGGGLAAEQQQAKETAAAAQFDAVAAAVAP